MEDGSPKQEELEERLARLATGSGTDAARLEELAAVERELWERLRATQREAPAQRRTQHPLVGVARAWRAELEGAEGASDAPRGAGPAERAEDLVEDLFEHEAGRWRERWADASSPPVLFQALVEAASLDYAVLLSGCESGERLLLSEDRAEMRRRFRAAIDESPPSVPLRRVWTDALVDAADDVRSAHRDAPHAIAAEQLALVKNELAWHLEAVEPKKGENRRRLMRKHKRLRAERVERVLAQRLEQRFGERRVALWDRAILIAIVLVLGLLAVPFVFDFTPEQLEALAWTDSAICAFFLWDFFFKAVLVRFHRAWLARHFWIDFLPSLPFGLLHAGFVLRLGRAWRLLRGLRLMLPAIRIARAVGFLAHGLDRMVHRYGHLLDHDVILHPTPRERARDRGRERPRTGTWRALGRVTDLWIQTLAEAEGEQRGQVALARENVFRYASRLAWDTGKARDTQGVMRQGPCAEGLLERLSTIPAEEIEGELGSDFVVRAARAARAVSRSPLRWLPVFHAYVPRIPRDADDAEATARVARRGATRLLKHYRRSQWVADLYGTVTPSGLVGGVGTALVRRTARPAGRLLILAILFALVKLVTLLFNAELSSVANHIESLVGSALIVLGSACLVLLGLGFWMQRLAKDASTFYEQVASAQFAHLTESIRIRSQRRDVALLDERVLALERRVDGRPSDEDADEDRATLAANVASWLGEGRPGRAPSARFDPIARTALLYRDSLDGSLLTEGDTRATGQLLGSLALQRSRARSRRFSRRSEKELGRLDLDRRRVLFGGPYLWFHFIAKAVNHGAARLVVDYNQHALPLDELTRAAPRTRERYRAWLERREAHPELMPDVEEPAEEVIEGSVELTTAFTTLHFLDRSERRDAEIERRFGPAVHALLQRDRRALFRKVFGSYPLHLRPPEERVLNLRNTYHRWFENGRVIFVPFRLFARAGSLSWQALRFIGRSVREIQNPELGPGPGDAAEADFPTAVRKIDRMRSPLARECVRQRAQADVEYLGVPLAGAHDAGGRATAQGDLTFLNAPPALRAEIVAERDAAVRDVRRLNALIEDGLLERATSSLGAGFRIDREHRRALTVAYRLDDRWLRSLLSWAPILEEVCTAAAERGPGPSTWKPRPKLWLAFRRYWREHGSGPRSARVAAWRAVARDEDGASRALEMWSRHGSDVAREKGEARLAELLRHPGRVTEEMVTLRAVQTLALIDVRNYRAHVWELGGYSDDKVATGAPLEIAEEAPEAVLSS
ncbi:MAG: ion transporter [bacterium]|nr:ion transporter [bacterium]